MVKKISHMHSKLDVQRQITYIHVFISFAAIAYEVFRKICEALMLPGKKFSDSSTTQARKNTHFMRLHVSGNKTDIGRLGAYFVKGCENTMCFSLECSWYQKSVSCLSFGAAQYARDIKWSTSVRRIEVADTSEDMYVVSFGGEREVMGLTRRFWCAANQQYSR